MSKSMSKAGKEHRAAGAAGSPNDHASTSPYALYYAKPTPIQLSDFASPEPADVPHHLGDSISQLQLYVPLYTTFFELNADNYNRIGLNHRYHAKTQHSVTDSLQSYQECPQEVFIKFSPLLDPIKYMVGKYATNDPRLKNLPQWGSTRDDCHEKILNPANASYVDAFFCYLSSVVKNHHHFVHAMDYYGSYLGIQRRYKMNVEEDLTYLTNSPYFLANLGKLMVLENAPDNAVPFTNASSRAARTKLEISDQESPSLTLDSLDVVEVDIAPQEPLSTNRGEPSDSADLDLVYHKVSSEALATSDTESEHSEHEEDSDTDTEEYYQEGQDSTDDDQEGEDQDEDEDEETEDDETEEEDEDQEAMVYIYDFPVQLIFLEKCEHTLDHLFVQGLSDDEAASALFQVVMTLLVYQKMFRFTHNDLHTNNIMYVSTPETHLTYRYQGTYWRVPTYGRIFKIIDYGRSIYKYQKRIFCSDSFDSDGDAATQYNCEPFFKASKPRLEPSPSFDLCRLGCSIYDFVFDDNDVVANEAMTKTELQRTIQRWCTDDQGRNVLYKKHGQERYPGFRLYKMIARTVKQHTPEAQLSDPWFQRYRIDEPPSPNEAAVMDVDTYPTYM